MTTYAMPICLGCTRFHPDSPALTCSAFPHGIPVAILESEHDHRQPYPGDRGLTYESNGTTVLDPDQPVVIEVR